MADYSRTRRRLDAPYGISTQQQNWDGLYTLSDTARMLQVHSISHVLLSPEHSRIVG